MKLDSVYVDTTFCVPEANFIPSRVDCLNIITKTAREWFSSGNNDKIVHVFSRTRYGYEFLMMALAAEFGCKVHVTPTQFSRYQFVPSLREILTTDAASTKIHFCQVPWNVVQDPDILPCASQYFAAPEKLTIVPSAMYFTKSKVSAREMVKCETDTRIRVCFSTHSSFEEIVDFLRCLKPRAIYPNVKPNSSLTLEQVRDSLRFLEVHEAPKSKRMRENDGDDTPIVFKRPRKSIFKE